jgi:hypothetical protein
VMNENSMTRTRATMKCAGWSMNSLFTHSAPSVHPALLPYLLV